MRASVLCSIVLSALVLAGCAAKGPPRVVKEEPPRLMFVGVDRIPNDIRSVPLFVSFEGSSSMTNYLREAFSKRGFLITNEKADARYSIQVNGHFTSKGKINVPPTALGPIFDSADAAVAARDYRTKTTGQALTTTAAFVQSAEMFGTGYMNIMGHSILDAISDATGYLGAIQPNWWLEIREASASRTVKIGTSADSTREWRPISSRETHNSPVSAGRPKPISQPSSLNA